MGENGMENRMKKYMQDQNKKKGDGSSDGYITDEEAERVRVAGLAIMLQTTQFKGGFSNSAVIKLIVDYPDLSVKERVCVSTWVEDMMNQARRMGALGTTNSDE